MGKPEILVGKSNGLYMPFHLRSLEMWIEVMPFLLSFWSLQLSWIHFVAGYSSARLDLIVLVLCARFSTGWFVYILRSPGHTVPLGVAGDTKEFSRRDPDTDNRSPLLRFGWKRGESGDSRSLRSESLSLRRFLLRLLTGVLCIVAGSEGSLEWINFDQFLL